MKLFAGFGQAMEPALPTYKTAADILEKKNGSGWKLAGWTIARTLLIGPPVMLAGVPAKKAFLGAAFASTLISVFTVLRIFNAGVDPKALGRASRPSRRRTRG